MPPGFEDLALQEINIKVPGLSNLRCEKGGVEFDAPLEVGLALNYVLKIPTEVRLRLAEFKCRDLPKLYQKISNLRWDDYLVGGDFSLNVSSSKSRLLNEKKIEKSAEEGIHRHFQKQPPKKTKFKFSFEILVRFFDDICTISLNTSGELLFKRGYKKMSAVAPLRENLAAAMYFALWEEVGPFDTLIDPMCGSGTFLLEAQSFWSVNSQREFDFQKKIEWVASKIFMEGAGPTQFYGFDKNSEVLKNIEESAHQLADCLPKVKLNLIARDITHDEYLPILASSCAVICNPPYGERLKLPKRPQEYYAQLLEQMFKFKPKGVGIILPRRFSNLVTERFSMYIHKKEWQFKNGGLPVVFRVYERKEI